MSYLGYGPYQTAKRNLTRMYSGREAQASKGAQARLSGLGLGNVPGVASDVATRQNRQFMGQLGGLHSKIDLQYARDKEGSRQFDAQLAFAKEQYADAKDWREKTYWLDMLDSLIGAGATIGAAAVGKPPGVG